MTFGVAQHKNFGGIMDPMPDLALAKRIHAEYLRQLDDATTMSDLCRLEGILLCEHVALNDTIDA